MTDLSARLADLSAAMRQNARQRGLDRTPAWLEVDRALNELAPGDAGDIDSVAAITEVFELSPDESNVLLIAAAAFLSPAFTVGYGLLTGSDRPQPATVALALELAGLSPLSGADRSLLSSGAPLRRWGLLRAGDDSPALTSTLSVDEGVIGALLGRPTVSDQIAVMEREPAPALDAFGRTVAAQQLSAVLDAGVGLVWIEEQIGADGQSTVEAGCRQAQIRYRTFDLADRPAGRPLGELAVDLVRRAGLVGAAVILTGAELLNNDAEANLAVFRWHHAPIPVILVGRSRWQSRWHVDLPMVLEAAAPTAADRDQAWREHLAVDRVPAPLIRPYRLLPQQIRTAAAYLARRSAILGESVGPGWVASGVRLMDASSTRSRSAAQQARTSFADLILPPDTMAELRRFSDWVLHRDEVVARGQAHGIGGKDTGIAALFAGAPGTGKTLAAHVVADVAGLELMQVDLSGVVDKYIGETEKNLDRIFTEAEKLNVLLFFDEADALFGRRSEVRDARDRYANQEISFLLQRIEHFNGVTLLASNLRGNIDAAFARRMHFIISFPDPDPATRRRMWTAMLERAGGQDPEDPIDIPGLAQVVELAGGDIRNIVLAATYDAVIERRPVGRRHVLAATIREYSKLGRRPPAGLG